MSLAVAVKGPEGIVLAADARITLNAQGPELPGPLRVNFDNATKLLTFGKPHNWVGAATYGDATIGARTAHSFLPELEPSLENKRLKVREYAEKISAFFLNRWNDSQLPNQVPPNGGMTFLVGGYNQDEPYGDVFRFNIPRNPEPSPQNEGTNFGMS